MNYLKMAALAVLALGSVSAFADMPQHGEGHAQFHEMKFDEMKANIIAHKSMVIREEQNSLNCVTAAQNMDQLRGCREKERQAFEARREAFADGKGHFGPPPGDHRGPPPDDRR